MHLILADFFIILKEMAIITIGGNVGAGKTTLAARLAEALGYEELYIGGLMRMLAAERGMSIEDFYTALKDDPSLERKLDEQQKYLMTTQDNLVVQGRIAWFFAKESPFTVYNIFLGADPETRAKRSRERSENATRPVAELLAANADREKEELERYRSLYGIENFLDLGHYDFALDTSRLSEDEVLAKILQKINERLEPDA